MKTEIQSPRPLVVPRSDPQPLAPAARKRLTRILIIKSIFDLVFVLALAFSFYYFTFTPRFRGAIETARDGRLAGWVSDGSRSPQDIEVQLYIDGRFVAGNALKPSGSAAPENRHSFEFTMPPLTAGEHEARVYALRTGSQTRRALQLVGEPMRFSAGG